MTATSQSQLGTSTMDSADSTNAEAGPSTPREIIIPSTGLEYWEYRRACFLAGVPFPSSPASEPLPESYTVTPPPEPLECPPIHYPEGSSIARLENLLDEFGSVESNLAWNGGVATVHRKLTGGTRFTKPLRLGMVIKILRAGWVRDGTWPMDPSTRRPVAVPDSPTGSRALAVLDSVPHMPPLPVQSIKSARKTKPRLMRRDDREKIAQLGLEDVLGEAGAEGSDVSPRSRSRLLPNPAGDGAKRRRVVVSKPEA